MAGLLWLLHFSPEGLIKLERALVKLLSAPSHNYKQKLLLESLTQPWPCHSCCPALLDHTSGAGCSSLGHPTCPHWAASPAHGEEFFAFPTCQLQVGLLTFPPGQPLIRADPSDSRSLNKELCLAAFPFGFCFPWRFALSPSPRKHIYF